MQEQRRFSRSTSAMMMEISHPSLGTFQLKAKDLSEGGAFVFLGNYPVIPVGTELKVRIKRHTGVLNIEPVNMRVVRHQPGGMGLMFI
jgi:hypothetical protein